MSNAYNVFIINGDNLILDFSSKAIGPFYFELENEEPTLNEKNTKRIKDGIKTIVGYDVELSRVDSEPIPLMDMDGECFILFGRVTNKELSENTKGIISIRDFYDYIERFEDIYHYNLRKIFRNNLSILNIIN